MKMRKQSRRVDLAQKPPAVSEERWEEALEATRKALVCAVKEGRYCPEPSRMHGLIVDKSPCTATVTVHEREGRVPGSRDLNANVGISIGAAMADNPEKFL